MRFAQHRVHGLRGLVPGAERAPVRDSRKRPGIEHGAVRIAHAGKQTVLLTKILISPDVKLIHVLAIHRITGKVVE